MVIKSFEECVVGVKIESRDAMLRIIDAIQGKNVGQLHIERAAEENPIGI
jgi:hypothetical protein